jgi:replicative superfamily II helicase
MTSLPFKDWLTLYSQKGKASLPSATMVHARELVGELQAHADRLRAIASSAAARQLRQLLEAGVGFHHAAMEGPDRELVERLFVSQELPVCK